MVWIAIWLIAFVATASLLCLLIPVAARVGLVDLPGSHKQHELETPLVGGLAMAGGFDDRLGLSVSARVAAQIDAILVMALWGGVVLKDLGHLLSSRLLSLGVFALPFTVLAAVGTINAMNLMDGIDGLAAALVLVVVVSLPVVAARSLCQTWLLMRPSAGQVYTVTACCD